MQTVFEPLTRERANGRPRILISDGFDTHESLEVLTFCFEYNIVLCRLPSHTSHKTQPCDAGVFSPMKTAYREEVEHPHRRGANTVNKEHFVILYRQAREVPMTVRNIRSGWSKAGLFPFNPSRVLGEMSAPIERPAAQVPPPPSQPAQEQAPTPRQTLVTPTTTEGVQNLYRMLEARLSADTTTHDPFLRKLLHATEEAFADRSLLYEENAGLLKQNDEKRVRQNAKSTVISQGNAKIMSYADIVEVQRRQAAITDAKEAKRLAKQCAAVEAPQSEARARQGAAPDPPCQGRAPVAQMW